MQRTFKATNVVLILLCAMYFITYIVRQNVNTAIIAIQPEFGLSNTQLGLIFSAFGYSLSAVPDHRRLDRRPFRAAAHAVRERHRLGGRDDPHQLRLRFLFAVLRCAC